MKNKDLRWELLQAEHLLEYDRRKIQDCADIFQNLAGVYMQLDAEEIFGPEEDKTMKGKQTADNTDREQLLADGYARDNRKSFAGHMRQMAGLLQDVVSSRVRLIRLGGHQERQIVRAMAGEGLLVSDIFILQGKEGRMELSVSISSKKERTVTVQEIAGYLSVLLDLRLIPQKRNPYFLGSEMTTLYFEEEPQFEYMTGAATAIREGEKISGDSFSFLEQDGKVTMLLSDGVGSGEAASADSGQVVELAEQILDAGLSGEMGMKLLNNLVRAQMREEHISTLDMCSVDLRRGRAGFVKAGGMNSFIKRGEMVETVGDHTLPLGFVDEEQLVECEVQLQSGDMIVLLSDGVFQEWGAEDCITEIQNMIGQVDITVSPQELANRILRCAITQSRGQIRDDMTVLVFGIWKNDVQKDGL